MTDTDVTFLPNYKNMDLAPFIRNDPYLPSVPASLQALVRVGCAMVFSIMMMSFIC